MFKEKSRRRKHLLLLAWLILLLSIFACADMFTEIYADEVESSCIKKGMKYEDGICVPIPPGEENESKSVDTTDVEKERIPKGTYKGIITDTELATRGLVEWELQGTVSDNQIIIIVANDGTVTGQFLYVKTGNILSSDDSHATPCIDSNDQSFVGEPTGQLTSYTGRIVFDIQHTTVHKLSEGCSIGPKEDTTVRDIRQHFEIEIIDGEAFGTSIPSTEDGHPVKAKFRLVKTG